MKIFEFLLISFALWSNSAVSVPNKDILSDQILITLAPIGERPVVFRSEKKNAVCRKGLPVESYDESEREAMETLSSNILADVNEGWFKIGLNFANTSDYYFVVENLDFTISAIWDEELLYSTKSISNDYCKSHPLYLIPPKHKVIYKPNANHSTGNLQIYVDEIPLPSINFPVPSYRVKLQINGHFMDEEGSYYNSVSRNLIFQTSVNK